MKNCLSRKMLKALTVKGMISALKVLYQPKVRVTMIKSGMRMASKGIIIVDRNTMKRTFLPKKSMRAKA